MVDLSRLMQDAAILEVIDKSADEASNLSAQNSYQAMRIEELERDLASRDAELAEWHNWGIIEVAVRNPNVAEYMRHWEQRAEAAERVKAEVITENIDLHTQVARLEADRDEWKRKAEEAARDSARLDWAEKNPLDAYARIVAQWADAGRGFREGYFNFRNAIDAAIAAKGEA